MQKRTVKQLLERWPDLEPAEFKMNALEEYFEEDSRRLENGLVVILAQPEERVSLQDMAEKEEALFKGIWTNRWCTVTEFQVDYGRGRTGVQFRGVYKDGESSVRRFHPDTKWLVKRDSIPKNKPASSEDISATQSHSCLTEGQYRAIAREEAEKALEGFKEGLLKAIGGFFSEA